MKSSMRIFTAILMFSLLLMVGCAPESENYFQKAQKALEEGDESVAQRCLLHEIAQNDTPEAHLLYAKLLGSQEEKSGIAAWHYRRYLELLPANDDAREVEKLAAECEQKYMDHCIRVYTRKEYSSLEEIRERMKMIEEQARRQKRWVEQLETEKNNLSRQLLELRNAEMKERRGDGK